MKKTSRWIISSVAFLLIGIILFLNIAEILRKKSGGESDMVHSFYEIERDTLDVLCMGSSHGYSAFQPNTLWKEYGLASYTLCSQRQTVVSAYYLLQEALKYQKPKVLLLETYYFWYSRNYADLASLRMGFDGIRMDEVKHRMIQDVLKERTLKDKLSYYIPFMQYHGRWDDLRWYDFHSKDYLKGAILNANVYPMEEPELPKEGREIADKTYEYFEKVVKLCEENDIQLILFTAPYGYKNEKKFESYMDKQKVCVTLESYLAEKNIPYMYFQKTNEAGIDYTKDFRDWAHLNVNGAIKITKSLGEYIHENYNLPDHRDDERYQSWWSDYYEFQEDMEKALKKQEEK